MATTDIDTGSLKQRDGVPLPDWPSTTLRADGQAGPADTPCRKRQRNPVSLRQNHQLMRKAIGW